METDVFPVWLHGEDEWEKNVGKIGYSYRGGDEATLPSPSPLFGSLPDFPDYIKAWADATHLGRYTTGTEKCYVSAFQVTESLALTTNHVGAPSNTDPNERFAFEGFASKETHIVQSCPLVDCALTYFSDKGSNCVPFQSVPEWMYSEIGLTAIPTYGVMMVMANMTNASMAQDFHSLFPQLLADHNLFGQNIPHDKLPGVLHGCLSQGKINSIIVQDISETQRKQLQGQHEAVFCPEKVVVVRAQCIHSAGSSGGLGVVALPTAVVNSCKAGDLPTTQQLVATQDQWSFFPCLVVHGGGAYLVEESAPTKLEVASEYFGFASGDFEAFMNTSIAQQAGNASYTPMVATDRPQQDKPEEFKKFADYIESNTKPTVRPTKHHPSPHLAPISYNPASPTKKILCHLMTLTC
eukprot:TRINITY_DN38164_c0_g1_i1.p1 TRINITY_DN38164_c0_g1~~TRINITY_DN38164_c0_g1_i1.p1  ORF type:complete len:409 (-),score=34.44 TRINITY_DN38164_c0_g1_i1:71-1297(-)